MVWELEEAARVAPIARSLWQLQLIAFPYFDFSILAPRGKEVKKSDEDRLLPKMEEVDRKIRTSVCCAQTMYDVITYGSALFELVWKTDDDGWIVPAELQRLPAASFSQAPPGISGNTKRYQCGNLLKGIVLDKEDNSLHYYQTQDSTATPIEIPSANIIHIKDVNSVFVDGEPYIAGIVSTISQLEFVRKRFMQTISRVGSPQMKVTVGVPEKYLPTDGSIGITSALPGASNSKSDMMFSQLWEFGSELARSQTADISFVAPEGVNVDWQRPVVPINPTDPDAYLIREAISHIFPRDVLEVLSASISTTSAPLLELLKIMVQGWQQTCAIPFENKLWTKFVEVNGFKDYRVELDWSPLIPEDKKAEEDRAIRLFEQHIITLDEVRSKLGETKLDEKTRQTLFDEMLKYRVPQSMMPQQSPFGGGFGGAPSGEDAAQPGEEAAQPGDEPSAGEGQDGGQDEELLSESEALLKELEAMGIMGGNDESE